MAVGAFHWRLLFELLRQKVVLIEPIKSRTRRVAKPCVGRGIRWLWGEVVAWGKLSMSAPAVKLGLFR